MYHFLTVEILSLTFALGRIHFFVFKLKNSMRMYTLKLKLLNIAIYNLHDPYNPGIFEQIKNIKFLHRSLDSLNDK